MIASRWELPLQRPLLAIPNTHRYVYYEAIQSDKIDRVLLGADQVVLQPRGDSKVRVMGRPFQRKKARLGGRV